MKYVHPSVEICAANTIDTIKRKEVQLTEFKKIHGTNHGFCKLLKLQIKKLREKANIYEADLKKLGLT